LVALYGPEHGIRGSIHAGDHVADDRDAQTGLPVYSLYGKTRKPTPAMLEGVDVLVYDVQDNGCRSYTFISTLGNIMEAAAERGIEVVVLDRPNPLGGERIEGRPLDLKFKSFVGAYPIPYVYGLTCGELAGMINGEGWLPEGRPCRLTVIPMQGYRRDMTWPETGLHWVPPSPHVPRADTAAFYAATGIMGELQVLSEGVGYTQPFELAGAPWIDAPAFARELNSRHLDGVTFRPVWWKHYYLRKTDEPFAGVQVHLGPRPASLTMIQFHVMDAMRKLYPDRTFFGSKRDAMFDQVCGTDQVRKMLEAGAPIARIEQLWNQGVDDFRSRRAKYLLYR
jgi:uncharacterized protein YbbC (DUF1343 family)